MVPAGAIEAAASLRELSDDELAFVREEFERVEQCRDLPDWQRQCARAFGHIVDRMPDADPVTTLLIVDAVVLGRN